jgi:RNA polymerase sigma factor (sigma-70 family)
MNDVERISLYRAHRRPADLEPVIRRHLDWVHAAALRQVGADPHLAADVTQAAFLALATRPPRMKDDAALAGWLFGVTRYTAWRAIRAQSRRRHHETEAAKMRSASDPSEHLSEAQWQQIAGTLDAAIARLPRDQRESVVLRFFQQRSYAEVGSAMQISEEAARKRVSRGLERLRELLAARGIETPAEALSAGLLVYATKPAPVAVSLTVGSATHLAAATAGHGGLALWGAAPLKWVAGILLATGLTIAGAVGVAQMSAPTAPPPRAAVPATLPTSAPARMSVDVLVADANNEPVAGAQVYLFQQNYSEERTTVVPEVAPVGPVTSDANGLAQFNDLEALSRGRGWYQLFAARVPGKDIGMTYRSGGDGAPIDPPAGPVRIAMSPTKAISGQISAPPGLSAEGVKVTTLFAQFDSGNDRRQLWFVDDIAKFRRIWPELFTATADASGHFTLNDMPSATVMTFVARGGGLGEKQSQFIAANAAPLSISMAPEGIIRGTLRDPGGKPLPNVPLCVYNETAEIYRGSRTCTTDANGTYQCDQLAEGIYALMLDRDTRSEWTTPDRSAASEWTMPVRANLRLAAGQTLEGIDLAVEHGVELKGTITDRQTGKPVGGAVIAALSPAETNGHLVGSGESDTAGQYTIRVPAGQVMLYVMSAGAGHDSPTQQGRRVIGISADGQIAGDTAFRLPQARKLASGRAILRGVVIDAANKAVVGVRLGDSRVEQWGAQDMPVQDPSVAVTDADGAFTIEVAAGIPHTIYISTPDYSGAAEKVTPQLDTATDLTITATPQPVLSTIEGRVVDPAGAAIADAIVEGFGRNEEARTDATGAFRAPLRTKEPATLLIRKGGYEYREFIVAPAAKDAKFVLYPTTRPTRALRNDRLPDSNRLLDQPAPPLKVAEWVYNGAPPTNGKPTLLLFTAVFDDGEGRRGDGNSVAQRVKKLQALAESLNANAVVIFSPESHVSAVRAALPELKVTAYVGVDEYLPETAFAFTGATQSRYGSSDSLRTQAFLINAKGKVQSDRVDINNSR